MTKNLNVYFKNKLAGCLYHDAGKISFQYNLDYINDENSEAISASMPLSADIFLHEIVEPFFSGLLPEDVVRTKIAKILKTDSQNTFELLKQIGSDCAGAISTYPPESNPLGQPLQEYKILENNKAIEVLLDLKKRPLYIGEDDFRVSGSGAQDKLIACVIDNKIALPLHGTPSTHIIKPNIEGYKDTTYNELFCMKLAALCGLRTPNTFIKKINNIPFYVVERYDRKLNNETWERIHQEDFCQILKIMPQKKYESDGGPSLKDCFNLLKYHELPASNTIDFLDLVIFNYLIGNGDAHGKNFSVLYEQKLPTLSPCYDLMCTAILAPYYRKHNMAMRLGSKKYLMCNVTRNSFITLAETTGFREDFILKRVDNLSNSIIENAKILADNLNNDENTQSDVYDKIIDIIKLHVERTKIYTDL